MGRTGLIRRALRWGMRGLAAVAALFLVLVLLYAVVNPPTTLYMASESRRLGGVDREWVDGDRIAPVMLRSVVAAEDANYLPALGVRHERDPAGDGCGRQRAGHPPSRSRW
jgi:monofunctional glycosyltransferase